MSQHIDPIPSQNVLYNKFDKYETFTLTKADDPSNEGLSNVTWNSNASKATDSIVYINGYIGKQTTPITSKVTMFTLPVEYAPAVDLSLVVPVTNGSTPTGYAHLSIMPTGKIVVSYMSAGGNIILHTSYVR